MKYLTLLLLLTASTHLIGQNLVPNPSFEQFTSCPSLDGQIAFSTGWFNVGGSPDYFNSCNSGNFGVPSNYGGFQQASSGNAYSGLFTLYPTQQGGREYMETILISPLSIATTYYVSFKVNLTNGGLWTSNLATDKIGALFTTSTLGQLIIPVNNFAHVYSNNILTDTLNWVEVNGSFVADSVYTHLSLGNFYNDTNTNSTVVSTAGVVTFAYYYIDDVCVSQDSLTCYNFSVGVKELHEQEKVVVYPNPTSGYLTITFEEAITGSLRVLNSLGQIVLEDIFEATRELDISLNGPSGIYFLQIESNGEIITKKIVKE